MRNSTIYSFCFVYIWIYFNSFNFTLDFISSREQTKKNRYLSMEMDLLPNFIRTKNWIPFSRINLPTLNWIESNWITLTLLHTHPHTKTQTQIKKKFKWELKARFSIEICATFVSRNISRISVVFFWEK